MCIRRLRKELQSIMKNPVMSPRIHATPNEDNILEWHYVVEGSEGTPYHGGFYHGKLIFPKEYPMKPPSVMMLTPSGRFKTNRRLCLSMSDFHPESWNPMWSVSTILTGMYSFMIETAPTLGSIETSDATKRQMAKQSLEYNVLKSPTFRKLFPDLVEVYKQRLEEARKIEGIGSGGDLNISSLSSSSSFLNAIDSVEGDGLFNLERNFLPMLAGFVACLSMFFLYQMVG